MEELENLVASPHLKVYGYGPDNGSSSCILTYIKKLEEIKCKVCCFHYLIAAGFAFFLSHSQRIAIPTLAYKSSVYP